MDSHWSAHQYSNHAVTWVEDENLMSLQIHWFGAEEQVREEDYSVLEKINK